jgi:hypothetical protein
MDLELLPLTQWLHVAYMDLEIWADSHLLQMGVVACIDFEVYALNLRMSVVHNWHV